MKTTKEQIKEVVAEENLIANQVDYVTVSRRLDFRTKNGRRWLAKFGGDKNLAREKHEEAWDGIYHKRTRRWQSQPSGKSTLMELARRYAGGGSHAKILLKGHTHWYLASPEYGFADYNRSAYKRIGELSESTVNAFNAYVLKARYC